MKTIKIIDLLNKIAKGEEVPKKIKHHWEYEYKYDELRNEYHYIDHENKRFDEEWLIFSMINDEIEILEEVEDKEYEDIEEITYKPRKVQNAINTLIRNQKYILERINKGE